MRLPHIISPDAPGPARRVYAMPPVRAAFIFAALLVAVAWPAVVPSLAAAAACPSTDQSYTGNCGPMFAVPSWTDAGGWNDPSQYSTIQLADVDGDGKDELIGRSDAGIQIYRFDTTWGQWRPQVDADGVPQLLDDFASFLPSNEWDPRNPNQASIYSTIQAADIDGQPGEEILGRFCGRHARLQVHPAGRSGVDGGSWRRIGVSALSATATATTCPALPDDPRRAVQAGRRPLMFARKHSTGSRTRRWCSTAGPARAGAGGAAYDARGLYFDFTDANCSVPSCYLNAADRQPRPRGPGRRRRQRRAHRPYLLGAGCGTSTPPDAGAPELGLRRHPPRASAVRRHTPAWQPQRSRLPVLGGRRDRSRQRRLPRQQPVVLRDAADRRHRRRGGR